MFLIFAWGSAATNLESNLDRFSSTIIRSLALFKHESFGTVSTFQRRTSNFISTGTPIPWLTNYSTSLLSHSTENSAHHFIANSLAPSIRKDRGIRMVQAPVVEEQELRFSTIMILSWQLKIFWQPMAWSQSSFWGLIQVTIQNCISTWLESSSYFILQV